jgi:pimeloyl-ACP methyl ester carboxylesterase
MVSDTRCARSGEINIAYRVAGEGPFDIVFVPGSGSHVEVAWEVPIFRTWFERFASFARLIHFDKRGTGMSDAVSPATTLETRMDDVRAVMDAAGSERAAVIGVSEGGPMSVLFAATYPDRAWALVLYGSMAKETRTPDYPWGDDEGEILQAIADMTANLSSRQERLEATAREACPSAGDEEVKALASYFRNAMTPGASAALARMNLAIDVRDVLRAIRVPTLVLHTPSTLGSRSGTAAISRSTFMVQRTSSYRRKDTSHPRQRRGQSSTTWSAFSAVPGMAGPGRRASPTVCSQPSSSRTSSVRANTP